MDLSRAELGEQYRIFVDEAGNISPSPNRNTMVATVIAVRRPGQLSTDVVLGWMAEQPRPKDAIGRKQTSLENVYVPNQSMYVYGKTVKRSLPVAIQIVNGLDGFPCKKCTNFFAYALPNRDDGTLICWSCRNTH